MGGDKESRGAERGTEVEGLSGKASIIDVDTCQTEGSPPIQKSTREACSTPC